MRPIWQLLLLVPISTVFAGANVPADLSATGKPTVASFELTSDSLRYGQPMPKTFTCEGANVSPPLAWVNFPKETQSYSLFLTDLDASEGDNDFVHWVVYDIPGSVSAMAADRASVMTNGQNSYRSVSYRGPCPPEGEIHHYQFMMFALNVASLNVIQPYPTQQQVLTAMKKHVLGKAVFEVTYES